MKSNKQMVLLGMQTAQKANPATHLFNLTIIDLGRKYFILYIQPVRLSIARSWTTQDTIQ